MARQTPRDIEPLLFIAILVFAAVLRFAGLGSLPLNEYEATHALQAFDLTRSGSADLSDQPGYVLITGALFWLFGAGEWLARLAPAVFGLAIVALPWFWRDVLGQRVTLVLALLLAIDPGMVALSHLAAGHMVAISAILIAFTAWRSGRPALAGSFAAVAVAASPTIWYVVTATALVFLALRSKFPKTKPESRRAAVIAFVATLAIGATLIFTQVQGLAAPANTLAAFMFGTPSFPGVEIAEILFPLVGYGFPVLIFGVLGALQAWRKTKSIGRALSVFAAFALALVLVNPNRQVADLAWVVLPMAALSATYIATYLHLPDEEPGAAYGEFALILLLVAFLGFSLARAAGEGYVAYFEPGSLLPRFSPSGTVAIAVAGLGALVTVLVALGWSKRSAAKGLVWALAFAFALLSISASTRFTRVDFNAANELWSPGPVAGDLGLLTDTLRDLSFWDQGQLVALPIELREDSAALHWALRDYLIESGDAPRLAVTQASESAAAVFAAYRGQSFALSQTRGWQAWPGNFFGWLLFRQAPTQAQTIVLWASPDLFPGDGLGLQPANEGVAP